MCFEHNLDFWLSWSPWTRYRGLLIPADQCRCPSEEIPIQKQVRFKSTACLETWFFELKERQLTRENNYQMIIYWNSLICSQILKPSFRQYQTVANQPSLSQYRRISTGPGWQLIWQVLSMYQCIYPCPNISDKFLSKKWKNPMFKLCPGLVDRKLVKWNVSPYIYAGCLTCELISMGSTAPYLGSTCPECGANRRWRWIRFS